MATVDDTALTSGRSTAITAMKGREGRGRGLMRMFKNKDWIACFFLGQGKPVVSAAE